MIRPPASTAIVALLLLLATACGDGSAAVAEGRTVRTSWWLAAEPAGRHLELTVLVGSSGCEAFDEVRVDEDAERVELIATLRIQGGGCERDFAQVRVPIRLDAPLGGRLLTGCAQRDDRLYPRPSRCDEVGEPGPAPRVGQLRPEAGRPDAAAAGSSQPRA